MRYTRKEIWKELNRLYQIETIYQRCYVPAFDALLVQPRHSSKRRRRLVKAYHAARKREEV